MTMPLLTLCSLSAWWSWVCLVHLKTGKQFYLGILRSSARTQMASERRATEPDWWVAASGVGTYSNSVLMPRATWGGANKKSAVKNVGRWGRGLYWCYSCLTDNSLACRPLLWGGWWRFWLAWAAPFSLKTCRGLWLQPRKTWPGNTER